MLCLFEIKNFTKKPHKTLTLCHNNNIIVIDFAEKLQNPRKEDEYVIRI